MQTRATLEFVFTMDEIWSCSSMTFCWFCPHLTENTRCAVLCKADLRRFIGRNWERSADVRIAKICLGSGKIWVIVVRIQAA